MKSTILSFVLLLSTILLQAQEVTIEGVSARGFSGVKSINGEFYYTFYFGEKTDNKGMANFILAIYDQNLTSIKNTEIEISKNSELAASAFNGQYFLFIFADLSKKKRTMVTLDKNGSIIKQTVEEDVRAACSSTQVTAHGFGAMARSGMRARTGAGLKGGDTRRERAVTCSRAAAGCLAVVGLDDPEPLGLKIFDVGSHASRH